MSTEFEKFNSVHRERPFRRTSSQHRLKKRVEVLLVVPDNMTAESLVNALRRGKGNFAVNTAIGTLQTVSDKLLRSKPDVAVISEELEDGDQACYEALRKLRESNRNTAAIMLLKSSEACSVVDAFREGARGVFRRNASLKTLRTCIHTVHDGHIWASNEDVEHIVRSLPHAKTPPVGNSNGLQVLTEEQKDIVRLVADGMDNRTIAHSLNVTEHSIRNHLYRIFKKLGISNRVQLILYLSSHGDTTN